MPAAEHTTSNGNQGKRDGFAVVLEPPDEDGFRVMNIHVFGAVKAGHLPALLEKVSRSVEAGELTVDPSVEGG
jgi:hypothetical protein